MDGRFRQAADEGGRVALFNRHELFSRALPSDHGFQPCHESQSPLGPNHDISRSRSSKELGEHRTRLEFNHRGQRRAVAAGTGKATDSERVTAPC